MGETTLMRNGSGYYDDTAFKALKNIKKEEKKAGDIYEDKNGNEYLVIKNHGTFCTSIRLNEYQKNEENEICVISRAVRYTNPAMVQYTFNDTLKVFIKEMPEDDFKAVFKAVQDALGMTVETVKDDQKQKIAQLEADLADWKEAQKIAFVSAVEAQEKLANVEKELESANEKLKNQSVQADGIPWEKMYNNLLDKIVGRM